MWNMWILAILAVLAGLWYLTRNIKEGFEAPYYSPWWRRYYRGPEYLFKGKYPYYNSRWYWWPHYGKNYYRNYWRNYGYNF